MSGSEEGDFSNAYELPDGTVQLYLRDPGVNMLEINWPDVSTLDHSMVPEIHRVPGSQDARLYLRR